MGTRELRLLVFLITFATTSGGDVCKKKSMFFTYGSDGYEYTYCPDGCCGDSDNQTCCLISTTKVIGIAVGSLIGVFVTIAITVCILCKRQRLERNRNVARTQTAAGQQWGTYYNPGTSNSSSATSNGNSAVMHENSNLAFVSTEGNSNLSAPEVDVTPSSYLQQLDNRIAMNTGRAFTTAQQSPPAPKPQSPPPPYPESFPSFPENNKS